MAKSDGPQGHDPVFPTFIRARLSGGWKDGVVLGTDNSVWLYRAVPMGPVADAKDSEELLSTAVPLAMAYEAMGEMASSAGKYRTMAKSSYRHTHLLVVNIPQWWVPPQGHELAGHLAESFPWTQESLRRVALFGVRLRDQVGGGSGWRAAVDSVAESLAAGGVPIGDYEADAGKVGQVLASAGFSVPSAQEFRLAEAWWHQGKGADAPVLEMSDCVHVFSTPDQVEHAARQVKAGRTEWDDLQPTVTVSMAGMRDVDLPFVDATDPQSWWVDELVNSDALVVSIRGLVEPAKVTREELRRNRRKNLSDIADRAANPAKMDRVEQDEQVELLTEVEDAYSRKGGASVTLTGASVAVGVNGYVPSMDDFTQGLTAELGSMMYNQRAAMNETMIASPVRASGAVQDLPATSIAYSGAASLSEVGDGPGKDHALVGFTERDRQPAWLDPMAASDNDTLPIAMVAGATGSGKTLAALWLADQLARTGRPTTFIDPKLGSDHSPAVEAVGGTVRSLDEFTQADGAFDPIGFAITKEAGVEIAASMLAAINPWGGDATRFEVPLLHALTTGVQAGARSTGRAMLLAQQQGHAGEELVRPFLQLAQSSPQFRAVFGMSETSLGLRQAEGLTYIKVGSAHLELPEPGASSQTLSQRIAMALVRMMVFGSAMALTGRDGTVMLDEAWVFLGAGRAEVERLGRLARSQRVFPMLFTQRVSDALDANLAGYISRGLILPIEDPVEAEAALKLFKLEATEARMSRITGKAMIGKGRQAAPNWNSMRALRDPQTGQVLRGAVGIYADMAGRAIPTEIALPENFLKRASTNKRDIEARQEQARRLAAQTAPAPDDAVAAAAAMAGW